MGVEPDFESDANLRYTHRRDGRTEIYFVANPADRQVLAHCLFRVTGKQPEVWDPMTGAMHAVRSFEEKDGRTRMELPLEPGGSAFVVFRKSGHSRRALAVETPRSEAPVPIEIRGPWQVQFQPGRGAPERIVMEELTDWSKHPDPGVKYFSGQATYRTTFSWDSRLGSPDSQLDARSRASAGHGAGDAQRQGLGRPVEEAVSGGNHGRCAARRNTLEVTVANLWPNRLIGDQSLPPEKRIAWTTWNPFKKDTPLLESGLLGPVRCNTIPVDLH